MNDHKVLIITYYWPPSGGSGVQRWLKFVKYLPSFGWNPIVVTPSNPSFGIKDDSLSKDVPESVVVHRLPIWEPYDLFFKFARWFGKKEMKAADFVTTKKNKSIFQKWSTWIRGNFFIPDARIFWVRPASRFIEVLIREEGIETIITTGPPHSMHLVGLRLKKKFPGLKWIADFRDPWSEWDLLDTLSLSKWARKRHTALEHEVITNADRVVTIAPYHVGRLEHLSGRKVDLLTNGFDEDDFVGIKKRKTEKFTLRHVGVVDELRDPKPVLEAIRALCEAEPDFAKQVKVEFVGQANSGLREYVQSIPSLNVITSFVNHIPHSQLLELYATTDVQLLILAHTAIAPGNLPGKFFEYLASGNPILALGPHEGDAAKILREANAGEIFERSDKTGIQSSVLGFYNAWRKGDTKAPERIDLFSRRSLTERLVREILN